jgi:hypothetical protein
MRMELGSAGEHAIELILDDSPDLWTPFFVAET